MTNPVNQKNPVSDELEALINRCEAAQNATKAAIEQANRTIQQAAALNNPVPFRKMTVVKGQLEQLAVIFNTVENDVTQANTLALAAPFGGNPKEIIAKLTPAIQKTKTAHHNAGAIGDLLPRIRAGVHSALDGGQTGPMLMHWEKIRNLAAPIRQQIKSAEQKAEEAIKKEQQLGGN